MNPATSTQYDFAGKYTQGNFITRRLLGGFFGCMERLVAPLKIASALEVGCGEGFSTQRLKRMLPDGASFEASDVEDRLVAAAIAANPDVPIRKESIYNLERADKSVDLVFCLEVLEHLEDPALALKELCRVSRQWVVLSVPREPIWRLLNMARLKYLGHWGNTPGHLQHYGARSFGAFVSGQAVVRRQANPLPWTIVLAQVR
jgi:2-polyprenyl-3-methyl-5-hydroxy-6-metoxy-1,4-benzoquinol methylase